MKFWESHITYKTYSNGSGCCVVVGHVATVFGRLICNGAGVSGDVGISSSGPDTSGKDFTRSFRKSNRLSDKMHCFLQRDNLENILQEKVPLYQVCTSICLRVKLSSVYHLAEI